MKDDLNAPYREPWEVEQSPGKVRPGAVVTHRNPELASWQGRVEETPRARKFLRVEGDAGTYVHVRWTCGEAAGKVGWYGLSALKIEA